MKNIAFVDLEVHGAKKTIMDIGATDTSGNVLHAKSIADLAQFLKGHEYLCGHNILEHDLTYLKDALKETPMLRWNVIDTLHLSPLLFPKKPYHRMLKDEKLQTDEVNNPLADALKAKELLEDEVLAFENLDENLKRIFYELLVGRTEFRSFFRFLDYTAGAPDVACLIREVFVGDICERANLTKLIATEPVALAYALAGINVRDRFSVTPKWVLKKYPQVEWVIDLLRNRRCIEGCIYCNQYIDAHRGLKRYFGFNNYRLFAGVPLQENAVKAALANKSILAIFPTGGGKSVTFQVPALIAGETVKGLTVIISPLQSLMKDQVDNLEKAGITEAVTINGLLDPIERAKALERVEDGSASILYISPEALRSRTMKRLLLGRKIARFVIDEAHCFSSWGQDFRVDYLYIGEFIKELQELKALVEGIPVSCFTATAKQKVVEDIRAYFRDKLGLELEVFASNSSRTNLQYRVLEKASKEEKYEELRSLIQGKSCPTIVYVSRTKTAFDLAERLSRDGLPAKPYHGQMEVREKSTNQDAFIAGEVPIMVATSAFGMGVDKKDVGMVIHFEISDSLENYIQEAGRAGRDEQITADCYVLYCEEDLDKHFILLNQTKINSKEIQEVWKAIKDLTRQRRTVSQSALEIARKAGWDESIENIETRVRTAIAALEQAEYVKRGQNVTKVFADSIVARNAHEAVERINSSGKFTEEERKDATRIILRLISSRSHSAAAGSDDDAVAQVDYIADVLAIPKERVMGALNRLREEGILADSKDLSAYIKRSEQVNKSLEVLSAYCCIERHLLSLVDEAEGVFNLKELNEQATEAGCQGVNPQRIRTILNYWKIKRHVEYANDMNSRNHVHIKALHAGEKLKEKIDKRLEIARFVLEYLYRRSSAEKLVPSKDEAPVDFSVHELKRAYEENTYLFKIAVTIEDIEDSLFYLSRIDALKIEGGFLVLYNPMTIERVEEDLKKRYTKEDYSRLKEYYDNKIQQIHIVGEYARKMIADYREALQFLEDYFRLNYSRFLAKYFPRRQEEISRNVTPSKFRQLFGELSPTQLKIINDKESKHICVLAGPGSGKTRVLVHKLASLILMEDVKYEQLLMLTFSRAAATEFKERLRKLIGPAANFIEIKTFHSYCFDLLGKMGSLEKSEDIIRSTIERIKAEEVEPNRLAKAVLVIDEAQDMDESIYALVQTLMEHNETMRVVMVGDDDQNIFQFRSSSAKYMAMFLSNHGARQYELLENYRSCANLVEFANRFAHSVQGRLKGHPIVPYKRDQGSIKTVSYTHRSLLLPFVDDIASAALSGTTCALTRTNDEALRVTGMLLKRGVPAKLIQTNDHFKLYDLDEIRYFMGIIKGDGKSSAVVDEVWKRAKKMLADQYQRSSALEACQRIINAFEVDSGKLRFISDFEAFVRESRLEDFYRDLGETIFVSTIHKAKGKEFDNVYLLLAGLHNPTEDDKRQLYVAMTRAKKNLTIHYNGRFLDAVKVDNLTRLEDREQHEEPEEIALQLGHADVWLNFFLSRQKAISRLQAGDRLIYRDETWYTEDGNSVFRVSKEFAAARINGLLRKGYAHAGARVNFVVWWQGKEWGEEGRIVLPEIYLKTSR